MITTFSHKKCHFKKKKKLSFLQNPTKKGYPLDTKILEGNEHEVGREK
jgi:glutaredoxin